MSGAVWLSLGRIEGHLEAAGVLQRRRSPKSAAAPPAPAVAPLRHQVEAPEEPTFPPMQLQPSPAAG